MNKKVFIFCIFVIGFLVRIIAIDSVPNGLNVDEASIGYEAYSILNYGIDRNGKSIPVFLEAWGSGQNALYAYIIMPFVKILGLSAFSVRLPMAIISCISLIVIYKLLNKEDGGKATLEKLLNGEDVDLANDEDMQDLMATYEDILIPYAQEGAISCDKWTARNAFFAEECAMLVGEGSYETPNIKNANPALLDYVKQDVLPISNTAEKNMLVKSTIGFSVSKNEDPNVVACAKDFLSFIASSEPARIWHQELMGNPTSIQSLTVSDKLPAIAKDTIGLDQSGRAKENMFIYMPSVIYTDMEENWAKFVAQAETKEEFLTRYQKIFKDLNDGFYD